MTKKRFVADNEYVLQDGGIYVVCGGEHSADVVATALNELLEENEQLRFDFQEFKSLLHSLEKENEQLKQSIDKYSDWIDSVKRENIDKVFKMSIFEIAEAFEYYKSRINKLEKELKE